jgi:hypothetical protein
MSAKRRADELKVDVAHAISSVDLEDGWMPKLLEIHNDALAQSESHSSYASYPIKEISHKRR